jgi:hypothetical protein
MYLSIRRMIFEVYTLWTLESVPLRHHTKGLVRKSVSHDFSHCKTKSESMLVFHHAASTALLPVPRPPFHATTMIPTHLAATRPCQLGEMAWTDIHLLCDPTYGLPSDCRGVCASNSCAHNKSSWKQQQLHTQHTTAWCKSQFSFGTYVVNLCSYIFISFWGFLFMERLG